MTDQALVPRPFVRAVLLLCVVQSHAAGQTQEFAGHEGAVTMGRFAPDGRSFVTVGTDGTVRVWDAASGTERRRYQQHTGPVYCLDASSDGRFLASGAQDNTVRIWDLPAATPLRTTKFSAGPLRSFAVSPDGSTVLAATAEGLSKTILVGRATKEDSQAEPVHRESAGQNLTHVVWRSDGAFFATGDASGRVRVLSPFLAAPQVEFIAHKARIAGLWFYGTVLVCAGTDGEVRMWQMAYSLAGRKKADDPSETVSPTLQKNFQPHEQPLLQAVPYASGTQVISVGEDGRVLLSDVNSGTTIREFTSDSGSCRCVAARRDNQRVACGTEEGHVLVWNAGNAQLLQTLEAGSEITHLAWSADNQKLAVVSGSSVHIFGPSLPGTPRQELVRHQSFQTPAAITQLDFSSDNQTLRVANENGVLADWPCASPVQRRQLNHGGAVYGVAFTRDGRSVVTCGADQTIRLWVTETGQQRFQMRGHQGAVHTVALTRDDTLAVSAGADGTLRLWDIVGGRQLKQLTKLDATMYAVTISHDGRYLAAGGADRKIRVIDMVSGDIVRTLEGHSDYIHSLCTDSSGDRLMSYGYAGYLKTWNFVSGEELTSQRIGRVGNFAQFSPDDARILLANGDGLARIVTAP